MGVSGIDLADSRFSVIETAGRVYGPIGFVGQYLPNYPTTRERINLIHQYSSDVMALWNEDQGALIGSNDYNVGYQMGVRAATAWRAIGLPDWAAIITDVEVEFYFGQNAGSGFIHAMHANKYTPGFYLNPPNGNNHTSGYQGARSLTKGVSCIHFTCQNCLNDGRLRSQFVTGGGYAEAVFGYESECVIWQNSIQQGVAPGEFVDLDTASTRSYFWQHTPPPQPIWHIKHTCALKPSPPSHLTGSEHTCRGGDVVDPTGSEQEHKNEKTGANELWTQVAVPMGSNAKSLVGWVLKNNLFTT
jgi:hypothetical protein